MTESNSIPEDELGSVLFGRPPNQEDWLRDVRSRVSLLCLDVPDKVLEQFLEQRLIHRGLWVGPHVERTLKLLENRTDGFLEEVHRLKEVVLLCGKFDQSTIPSQVRDAYQEDLEWEASEIISERELLVAEFQEMRSEVDQRVAPRLAQVQRQFEAAALESGAERNNLLREGRNILLEYSNAQSSVHPVIWLYQGWAMWQLSQSISDVSSVLARVTDYSKPTISAFFAYRLLSYFSYKESLPIRALEWAKHALDVRQTPEANVEAGLCAAAMHDPSVAKAYFEQALVLRAGSIVSMLADDRVLAAGTDVLEVAVRVQLRLRRDGRQAASNWASASKQVAEVQKQFGRNLGVAGDLLNGHKEVIRRLEAADILTAGTIIRTSQDSAKNVLDTAHHFLDQQLAKRSKAVSEARQMIEGAGAVREQRIEHALRFQEQTVRESKRALAQAESEAERTQHGAILGLGSGCGLFALYIVSYAVLTARGMMIGLSTPVGFFSTVISAIPIVLAIGIQIKHGLKKYALEQELADATQRATQSYETLSREADDVYRDQVSNGRKSLDVADADIKKVESALKLIAKARGGSRLISSPRLQQEEPETGAAQTDPSEQDFLSMSSESADQSDVAEQAIAADSESESGGALETEAAA